MPEDPKPEETPTEKPEAAEDPEQEAGDFITRQVLEKDSVFFEG